MRFQINSGDARLSLLLTVSHDLVKGDLEPFGVAFGMDFHVLLDGFEAHVFPGGHLLGVDVGGGVALSEPHVVEFVLDKAESDGGLIYKGEDLVHVAGHAHLFLESPGCGVFEALALAGMAAAAVGPQTRGVVF